MIEGDSLRYLGVNGVDGVYPLRQSQVLAGRA